MYIQQTEKGSEGRAHLESTLGVHDPLNET